MRMKRGPCCAVKGDVGACDFRWRRGYPDKTDAATNRRWVTAGTPPPKTSGAPSDRSLVTKTKVNHSKFYIQIAQNKP